MTTNGTKGGPLSAVRRGKLESGLRYVFYGPEAIGKSSLAAAAPAPIFIDCEDGTGQLDVARYPFRDGRSGHVPDTLEQVNGAIEVLATQPHEYRTLVIDTMDALEDLIHEHVLVRDSAKISQLNPTGKKLDSIESYGFGKGQVVALEAWRDLANRLDLLRLRTGMSVVLLGHTAVKLFKNPEGDDYDRFQFRIGEKSAGFLRGWADVVGFCRFEEGGGKLDARQRAAKGWSTGRRLAYFDRTATFDAKTRIPLPLEVELSASDPWGPLAKAIAEGRSVSAEDITKRINARLAELGDDELSTKVAAAVTDAKGDVAVLSRFLNKLLHQMKPKAEEGTDVRA